MKHLRVQCGGLAVFLVISLFSCSPRYGAHFQKTNEEARYHNTTFRQEKTPPPKALVSIAPDRLIQATPLQESDKVLMDKLLDLQNDIERNNSGEERREIQDKKEALVLEAVRSKLGSMTAPEKKTFRKAVRQAKKEIKGETRKDPAASIAAGLDVSESTLLLVLVTILIPPLGVYLYEEEINEKFWIALVLTLLFYVPGLIYSLIVIL